MIAWEYKIDKLLADDGWPLGTTPDVMAKVRADRMAWLNRLGDEGWELIKLDYAPDGMHVVMKRGRTG